MYVIKEITVDEGIYVSSKVVDCTTKTIGTALSHFENSVRDFMREEIGKEADNVRIIDVHSLEQVVELPTDGMVCYRLADDPHKVNIYHKKTTVTKQNNWTWGQSDVLVSSFKLTTIYELEECGKNIREHIQCAPTASNAELVSVGPAHIRVPKLMTMAPMCDVIAELKKSATFLARLEANH